MSFQHEYPYGDVHELNLDWIMQTMQEFINSEREAGHTPTVSSVRSFFTHKYPYGDIHELNLDWVIQTALRMEEIGDSVEGDIGALQTRMTAAEGNISTLDNSVSGLSDSIGQIESEIEEIQGDVTAIETVVGQHTTQITALDQKIDTQVVANPAEAATDTLSKIEIAGTVYTVEGSGGSEVEANPAGETTDTLETIGIDGTIYEVGGSSNIVHLTQAEYDVLPSSKESDDKVYMIEDTDPDILTFDTIPTYGSNHPVTSDGIRRYVDSKTITVYGMRIDGSESNPSSKVTYLEDAVGMTPGYMNYTTDKFNYGSWEDAWFIKGVKPCILNSDGSIYCYLDKNDNTKDVNGNDVSDIVNGTTDFGQNCMVEFPKIWLKTVPVEGDDTSGLVYFSPVKLDDDYHDFPYIDQNSNHKEHFYMPMYNGSIVNNGTTNVMRSLSGKTVSKSLNAQAEIDVCTANGNGWYTEDAGEVMLINFLLMLIGKSTDIQTVFGRGLNSDGNETINNGFTTGIHSDKGMFYGTNSGAAATYTNAVKIFGIENWWGFQWRRYAGDINASGTRKVKMCYGTEDGSTVNTYNADGTGYVDVGATPSGISGGYISQMKFISLGMFSAISSGSSSTHYCDGQWFDNNQTDYALRGGDSHYGARVGAFFVALTDVPSSAGWYNGAAPSYK